MPAWKGKLDDAEVRAMVVFIREKGELARRANTVFARPQENQLVQSREHAFRQASVADGLRTPWSVAFLPDGRMLVTELPGRLLIVEPGAKAVVPVIGTPEVWTRGQGGLMDVALLDVAV